MEIRTARPEDADAVSNVLTASYAVLLQNDYDPETLVPALSFMGKAQPDLLASGTFYLAHIGGRLAACGGWTANAPGGGNGGKPGVGHIRHFATHPDMVRRGASAMACKISSGICTLPVDGLMKEFSVSPITEGCS